MKPMNPARATCPGTNLNSRGGIADSRRHNPEIFRTTSTWRRTRENATATPSSFLPGASIPEHSLWTTAASHAARDASWLQRHKNADGKLTGQRRGLRSAERRRAVRALLFPAQRPPKSTESTSSSLMCVDGQEQHMQSSTGHFPDSLSARCLWQEFLPALPFAPFLADIPTSAETCALFRGSVRIPAPPPGCDLS